MNMKIGINASYAVSERPTGIGNYIIQLIRFLLETDKTNEYILYYRKKIRQKYYLPFDCSHMSFNPYFNLFSNIQLDLLHDPSFKYIKIGNSKTIITIHDIVVALKQDYTSEKFKKKQIPKLIKALSKADHIIAVSQYTKEAIMRHFSVNPEKISVVYHGVDSSLFKPANRDETFLKKYNLPQRYLLFVGNIEKRKNLINIVKSFTAVIAKDKNIHLVLAGKDGYGSEEIRQYIKESPARNKIIELNYISNNELPLFYQNAEIFLFPTFYEGFGMPILEALACGCPVITSHQTAMPEAGGDAVVYVEPDDENEIAEKILEVLKNHTLQTEMKEKGFRHIKDFTWEQTAQKTLDVYKKCVSL